MVSPIFEKILADVFQVYLSYDNSTIEKLIANPNLVQKERIGKINDLEIHIYTNDHNPPHFHVKTRKKNIDAKFSIETGEFLSGTISTKNIKRVMAFYNSPKTKLVLERVWNKRNL